MSFGLKAAKKDVCMWYFAWVLGVGFAVLLAILNAMWGENEQAREVSRGKKE
jgi:cyd operon protein YbgT